MLDEDTRSAVLQLVAAGQPKRAIAKALKISRETVAKVVAAGVATVPVDRRASRLDEHRERIVALQRQCRGNLVRVHECLQAEHVEVGYSALTQYCRQHKVGKKEKKRSGEYHFGPGQEMQHDTSPHRVVVGGHEVLLQCASLVLCHSRMLYAQVYWRWSRLEARQFLTEALVYFGGAAGQCEVDNSNVILLHGTGKNAVPAPEFKAFGDHFSFAFQAHELGDANRSARVERPFGYIERNFYPGRTFADLADCNAQFGQWCETNNSKPRKHLHGSPRDLLAAELAHLQPLPAHIPEVYASEPRTVDLYGCVTLHTNRYTVPARLIGEQVQVREYKDKVRVYQGPRRVAEHPLLPPGRHQRHTLPEHRHPAAHEPRQVQRHQPVAEEVRLRAAHPDLSRYVDGLRARHPGRAVMTLRRLLRIWQDYPQASIVAALSEALHYGMYDLGRLEKMVLRRVAGDVFGQGPAQVQALDFDLEDLPDDDPDDDDN